MQNDGHAQANLVDINRRHTLKSAQFSKWPQRGTSLRLAGKERKLPPTALRPCLWGWVSPAVQTNEAKLTQPRKQGKAKTSLVYINWLWSYSQFGWNTLNANAEISATLKMATKGHKSKNGREVTQIASEGSADWPESRRALKKSVGGLDCWAEANGMNYNETECHIPHVACNDLGRS